ncbi:hypothetical protein Btru_011768 [Bulinus truncatus]|nr:hypothetical protein Btru_011768 [Bulinus truncatus]
MATQNENEDSALDSLIHSLEFENKNFIKMIDKENQLIEALKAQTQKFNEESNQWAQRLPQLEEDICNYERQYASIQDNIESQKKTRNLLFDHEFALTKQLETMKLSTEEKCKFYQDQISKYEQMKDEYMKKYATLSLAVKLKTAESKLAETDQKLKNILDIKAELKQQIKEKEEYLDARVLNRIVIKIAKTKLETIRLNKEITMIQAENSTSIDMDSPKLPEKLNCSQLCSQTDQADVVDKIPVGLGIDDYCEDINDEYPLSPNKMMSGSGQGAIVSSVTEEEFHPNLESETTSDVGNNEQNDHAQNNQRVITDFHNPVPKISTSPSATRKPLVQFPSFRFPSLPKLPTMRHFSDTQSMNKVQQPDHQTYLLQKDQQLSINHLDTKRPSTSSLQNDHFAEKVGDVKSSTSQLQRPASSLLSNEQLARNYNEVKNTTPSQFQMLPSSWLQNEHLVKNVNEIKNSLTSEWSGQNEMSSRNSNDIKNTASIEFPKTSTAWLQNGHPARNNHKVNNTSSFQFQAPTASLLQSKQLAGNFSETSNNTSKESHFPSASLMINDQSSKSLPESSAVFQFKNPFKSLLQNKKSTSNFSEVTKDPQCLFQVDMSTPSQQNEQLTRSFNEVNSAGACQPSTLLEQNKIPARNLEKPSTSEPFSKIQLQESWKQIGSETGQGAGFMNTKSNIKLAERIPSMFDAKDSSLANLSPFKEISPVKTSKIETAGSRKFVFEDIEAQRGDPSNNNNEAVEEDQPEFSFNFTSEERLKNSGNSSSTKGSTYIFGQFGDLEQDIEDNDPTFLSMANCSPEKYNKVDWSNFLDDDDSPQPAKGKDLF